MESPTWTSESDDCHDVHSPSNQEAMLSDSEELENGMTQLNPLDIGSIAEKILSFLDVDSIKEARLVKKLWSAEGAKLLITRCYIQIPRDLFEVEDGCELPSQGVEISTFKAFLSHKVTQVSMIPNITIAFVGDVALWQSFGVLGPQVNAVKLKFIDDEAEMLQHLLEFLPNLKYLKMDLECDECIVRADAKECSIMKVLTSEMSKPERDGKPLVLSCLIVRPWKMEQLRAIFKFANCKNIMIENLFFVTHVRRFHRSSKFESRILSVITKLLHTSRDVLKKVDLCHAEIYLSLLQFPCMTKLLYMDLNFSPPAPDLLCVYEFHPSFRFSEKMPNLEHIGINYEHFRLDQYYIVDTNFFHVLFENTGTVPSVKSLKYADSCIDFEIEPLFRIFPNLQEFETINVGYDRSLFHALWKYGKKLKRIKFHIVWDNMREEFINWDSFFTGFDPETVYKMKKSSELTTYSVEELELMRVYPSIVHLRELELLVIDCIGNAREYLPRGEGVLTIAGEYAFRFLPSDARVIIGVQGCEDTAKDAMDYFNNIADLPNVVVHSCCQTNV